MEIRAGGGFLKLGNPGGRGGSGGLGNPVRRGGQKCLPSVGGGIFSGITHAWTCDADNSCKNRKMD